MCIYDGYRFDIKHLKGLDVRVMNSFRDYAGFHIQDINRF